ncbi:MAG: hypothetical protein EBT33_02330 [Betaproteobacteria bacterium]|nr:hypothetical protein [Betaproteobacteria bacterium]
MQSMAASLKHLIDSPASIDGETGSPSIACCRVMDAIAGDCSSSFGERLKIVEAECGFGERCSRGCAGLPPADCSLIGAGRSSIGRVALSSDTVASGNAPCFDAAGSAGGSARGSGGSTGSAGGFWEPRTAPPSAPPQAVCASTVVARPAFVSPIPRKV